MKKITPTPQPDAHPCRPGRSPRGQREPFPPPAIASSQDHETATHHIAKLKLFDNVIE
ncbi:MAG TPA: hypothetical protein V6D02_06515 [Candidatus Obscuribacterales bacterium]